MEKQKGKDMNSIEVLKVINKLVGRIHPVGESHTDSERLENLKVMCEVCQELMVEINSVNVSNKHRYEHSVLQCQQMAEQFINKIKKI